MRLIAEIWPRKRTEVYKFPKIYERHLTILGARRGACSKFQNEDPQLLCTICGREDDIKTQHKETGCEETLICCGFGQELEAGGCKHCLGISIDCLLQGYLFV